MAEEEKKRVNAKAVAAALLLETSPASVPTTKDGLDTAVIDGAVGEKDTEMGLANSAPPKDAKDEVEGSDCSREEAASESSDESSEEEKPVHAVIAPIPTDKKFWVCEIPLSDVENQNATRQISSLLLDLQERRATRASYVSALCIAQSVVFGAIPLQITKDNYSEECAKKIAALGVSTTNAAEPIASVAGSSPAPVEETADALMEAKEEAPKSS